MGFVDEYFWAPTSGMEVSLDLSNHNAKPSMVVRSSVNVLPREMMGKSIFDPAMMLMKWLPLWLVDKILLILAWFILRSGEIRIVPGIKRFGCASIELVNGDTLDIDSVVLATGYCSNVPYWLQETEFFAKMASQRRHFQTGNQNSYLIRS